MKACKLYQEKRHEKIENIFYYYCLHHFLTEVYMLFPNMNGETGVGNTITVPVDANTGDIFSTLKLGGMVYLEASTKKWAITSDFVSMNLEKDITATTLIHSGAVGVDEYIWEAAGLYRINHFLELT